MWGLLDRDGQLLDCYIQRSEEDISPVLVVLLCNLMVLENI